MSEAARAENVETVLTGSGADVMVADFLLERIQAEIHEALTTQPTSRRGIPYAIAVDLAAGDAARAVLPIVDAHAKAERKAGAVDALRAAMVEIHEEAQAAQHVTRRMALMDARKILANHFARIEAS